jgi:hypothetical protein
MTKRKSLALCAVVVAALLVTKTGDAALPQAGDMVASDAELEYLASIGGLYRNKGTDGAGESYSGITAVLPRVDDVRMIWWVDRVWCWRAGPPFAGRAMGREISGGLFLHR